METELIKALARFGPEWVVGGLGLLCAFVLGKHFLEELKEQNRRKLDLSEKEADLRAEIERQREQRKQAEQDERARRDRERSEMEGRIAAQMERSNTLMDGMKALMESVLASNEAVRTSNETLHSDFLISRERSQDMAEDVTHIRDRVDLLYDKESNG